MLEGVIERATLPGPPNYQSVAKGDRKETYWLLRVRQPFCVDASFDESGDVVYEAAELRKRDVQLVFDHDGPSYKEYRALLGRKVRATGELFAAHTGHHHTDLLLTVERLAPAR